MARSRGRATSPLNRAGTILVARNGSRPLPGKMPVPDARWLERGWIKGSPLSHVGPPPIRGIQTMGKVYDLCQREGSAGHRWCKHPAAVAARDPFGKAARESRSKLMSIRNARLGFARMIEHPGKHARSMPRAMADDDVHGNLQFGPFELSSRERVLRRDGVVLPLGGRALDILIYLAERPGEVITKQELIDHVWSDVTVEEGSIRVHVAAIRKALGDGQFGNRYIANIKGRGYSFVGTVVPLAGDTESRNAKFRHQGRPAARPP